MQTPTAAALASSYYAVMPLPGDRGVEVLRRYAEARREKLPLKIILVRVSDAFEIVAMQPSGPDVLLSTKDMANQKGGLLSLAVVTVSMIGSSAKTLQRNCGFSSSRVGSRSENSDSLSDPWSQQRNLDKTLFKTKGDNLMELTESCPEIFQEHTGRILTQNTATLLLCRCFPVLALCCRAFVQRLSCGSGSSGLWRSTVAEAANTTRKVPEELPAQISQEPVLLPRG